MKRFDFVYSVAQVAFRAVLCGNKTYIVMKLSTTHRFLLLALVFASGLLLSPKWFTAFALWVHLPATLLLLRTGTWRWWVGGYVTLVAGAIVAQHGVFPLPLPALVTFMAIANLIGMLPYLIDRWAVGKLPAWCATLAFPIAATLLDIFASNGPQGSWGNTAYTQFHFRPLMQLAAVTGIFGINFLTYWFAAVVTDTLTRKGESKAWVPFGIAFLFVIGAGSFRLLTSGSTEASIPVAAVNLGNDDIYEAMYAAAFDKTIDLPTSMEFSDPVLVEVQKGMDAFMADPEAPEFAAVHTAIDETQIAYLKASARAVAEGAKIITWSEAAILTVKSHEDALINSAAKFADENDCYLFYPIASFHPDKYGESVFIENKVITFGPNGQTLNTYFKNIPVMGVEPSFPGDGKVPAIATEYGKLSPVICYDADHPDLIAQTSTTETGLLVVPTGDWDAIAPLHTYMAAVRSIENGVPMLKATNHGTSALVDAFGRVLAEEYLTAGDGLLTGSVQVGRISTPYSVIAPAFALMVQVSFLVLLITLIGRSVTARYRITKGHTPAPAPSLTLRK